MFQPYRNKFIHSSDHLPKLLQGLFLPAYLESDYTELLKFPENHFHDEVTTAMVDYLAQLTCKQFKSIEWFKSRAGRITASHFRQVYTPHRLSSTVTFIAEKHYIFAILKSIGLAPKLLHGAVNMKKTFSKPTKPRC